MECGNESQAKETMPPEADVAVKIRPAMDSYAVVFFATLFLNTLAGADRVMAGSPSTPARAITAPCFFPVLWSIFEALQFLPLRGLGDNKT